MKTIGSHPGAILFRLSIMIILIAILMIVFFSYLDDTERELERSLDPANQEDYRQFARGRVRDTMR